MFTGSSKEKKVSLSGRKPAGPTDKTSILQQSQDEREKREKLKRQLAASGLISRVWRGSRCRAQHAASLSAQLDKKLQDMTKLSAAMAKLGKTIFPPTTSVSSLAKLYFLAERKVQGGSGYMGSACAGTVQKATRLTSLLKLVLLHLQASTGSLGPAAQTASGACWLLPAQKSGSVTAGQAASAVGGGGAAGAAAAASASAETASSSSAAEAATVQLQVHLQLVRMLENGLQLLFMLRRAQQLLGKDAGASTAPAAVASGTAATAAESSTAAASSSSSSSQVGADIGRTAAELSSLLASSFSFLSQLGGPAQADVAAAAAASGAVVAAANPSLLQCKAAVSRLLLLQREVCTAYVFRAAGSRAAAMAGVQELANADEHLLSSLLQLLVKGASIATDTACADAALLLALSVPCISRFPHLSLVNSDAAVADQLLRLLHLLESLPELHAPEKAPQLLLLSPSVTSSASSDSSAAASSVTSAAAAVPAGEKLLHSLVQTVRRQPLLLLNVFANAGELVQPAVAQNGGSSGGATGAGAGAGAASSLNPSASLLQCLPYLFRMLQHLPLAALLPPQQLAESAMLSSVSLQLAPALQGLSAADREEMETQAGRNPELALLLQKRKLALQAVQQPLLSLLQLQRGARRGTSPTAALSAAAVSSSSFLEAGLVGSSSRVFGVAAAGSGSLALGAGQTSSKSSTAAAAAAGGAGSPLLLSASAAADRKGVDSIARKGQKEQAGSLVLPSLAVLAAGGAAAVIPERLAASPLLWLCGSALQQQLHWLEDSSLISHLAAHVRTIEQGAAGAASAPEASISSASALKEASEACLALWQLQQLLEMRELFHVKAVGKAAATGASSVAAATLTPLESPAATAAAAKTTPSASFAASLYVAHATTPGVAGSSTSSSSSSPSPFPSSSKSTAPARPFQGSSSFLLALWQFILSHPELKSMSSELSSQLVQRSQSFLPLHAALQLFYDTLAQALLCLSDLDFFEGGKPLPLPIMQGVVELSKMLLQRLCWSDSMAGELLVRDRPLPVLQLTQAVLRVFNLLFDRHNRRPGKLCKAEDWLWSSSLGSSLTNELTVEVMLGLEEETKDEAVAGAGILGTAAASAAVAGSASAVPSSAFSSAVAAGGAAADVVLGGAAYSAENEDQEEDGSSYRAQRQRSSAAAGAGAGGSSSSPSPASLRRARQARLQLVLTNIPQVIPFEQRVGLFNKLLARDKAEHASVTQGAWGGLHKIRFTVRRASLLQDSFLAFQRIASKGGSFKDAFGIEFINREGLKEAGIDGGGLLKEYIDSVVKEAFTPGNGLFKATEDHTLYPNPASAVEMRIPRAAGTAAAAAAGAAAGGAGGGGVAAAAVEDGFDAFQEQEEEEEEEEEEEGEWENEESDGGMLIEQGWPQYGAAAAPPAAGGAGGKAAASAAAPSPSTDPLLHLRYFEFLGRLLGKAMYEGILVEPRFASFFLRKLLGKANLLDDLSSLDPALYKATLQLRGFDEHTLQELGLVFEAADHTVGGSDGGSSGSSGSSLSAGSSPRSTPLLPGGSSLSVSSSNVDLYIALLAQRMLNEEIAAQCAAFLQGFRSLIPLHLLRMFGPAELQTLLGGDEGRPIDVSDWQSHTAYGGGYHPSQPYIQSFWRVVGEQFSEQDRRSLLAFVTSCSRPPLLGFAALQPTFGITFVPTAGDEEKLPTASSCFSQLKLPKYSSEKVLRQKLLLAIHSGAGFELT